MSIDITMFQQAFFDEATELLDGLETQILELEGRKDDLELLNTIFRCAHSIKGGSATFGFPSIASFTHRLETLLDQVRSGVVSVSPELCSVLFRSLDQMRALLGEAMGTRSPIAENLALNADIERLTVTGGITRVATVAAAPSDGAPKETRYRLQFAPGPDVMRSGCDPCLLISHLTQVAEVDSVQRDDSKIPPLAQMDPERCYVTWDIHLHTSSDRDEIVQIFEFVEDESEISLTTVEEQALVVDAVEEASTAPDRAPKPETSMLRVTSEKVDRLVDLVGELVIAQSMLQEAATYVDFEHQPKLAVAVAAIERSSRELQERVMGIRLVQLKHAFARFPRLVRDLSTSVGKRIDLVTFGEETELDKTLIEALGDPLTHLVRNSIDHGLETPEERKAAGKSEVGTLRIESRYEGGCVVIELSDDGRGLDRERILVKAMERGLLSPGDSPSDEVIYSLIFQPGFSTAKAVTDLSGRGVGMDIVRQAIQSMNGSISLTTAAGQGTKFRIRLPLTMAIMEGLSLRIGTEIYILPLTSIVESLRPLRKDLNLVAGHDEIVNVRGEVLRVLRLHEFFHISSSITDPCEGILVIVENEGHKIALLVDELITLNQAVIKSLEVNYKKVDGITGATVLGDGKVALIIDVPGLLRGVQTEAGSLAIAA